MGVLSVLGKLAKPIVGLIPGGGTLTGALDLASGVGGMLGAGAKASQDGRMNQAMLQSQMNGQNNVAQLNASKFNMDAPSARMSQAAHADVLANAHNAPMTGDPRIDKFSGGGLRPDLFGQDTRNGANEMKRQALMALMTKSDQVHPQLSTVPKAGMLEKIGGAAGLVGGLAGMAGEATAPGGLLAGLAKQKPATIADMGPVDPYQMPGYGRV